MFSHDALLEDDERGAQESPAQRQSVVPAGDHARELLRCGQLPELGCVLLAWFRGHAAFPSCFAFRGVNSSERTGRLDSPVSSV